jgi:mannosyltransferase
MGIAVAIIAVVGLFLRLWGLTRQSLWVDEQFTLKFAGLERPLTWGGLLVNLQGPLHAAFLHVWCGLFGWGELAVRLPQALISAASVPLLFVVARPVFGDRKSLAASVLLAVNPFHIWYAQEVRNYSLVMLFAILGLGAMQRFDATPASPRRVVHLSAVWVGGLLSNLSFAFHVAAVALWGVFRFHSRKRAMVCMGIAAAITLLACLPWIVQFYERRVVASHLLRLGTVPVGERIRGETTAPVLGLPYAAYAFSAGFTLGPSLRELRRSPSLEMAERHAAATGAVLVVFGTLAVAGLIRWLRGDARNRLWLLALALPVLLAFVAAARNVKVFNPRYASAALPAYVLLLVDGACALNPRRLGAVLFAGVVGLSAISIVQMNTQPRYWKEDARSTAAVLRAEAGPGDLVFMIGGWDPIARYYWTALRDDPSIRHYFPPYRVSPEKSPTDAENALEQIRSARRTYVVFCRDDFEDPEGRWEAFLRERFTVEKRWEFPGSRIWKLGGERVR